MSTIAAATLRDSVGATEILMKYAVRGSSKAWASLNGSGTIALKDSLNIASATDNGTGDFSLNFSSAMANTNFNPVCTTVASADSASRNMGVLLSGGLLVGAVRTLTQYDSGGTTGIVADYAMNNVSLEGVLA